MSLLLAFNFFIRFTTIPAYSTACTRKMSNVHRVTNRGSRIVSAKSGMLFQSLKLFEILYLQLICYAFHIQKWPILSSHLAISFQIDF